MRLFESIEQYGATLAIITENLEAISFTELVAMAAEAVSAIGERRALVAIECNYDVRTLAAYVGALRSGHVAILLGSDPNVNQTLIQSRFTPQWRWSAEQLRFEPTGAPPVDLHPDLALLLSTSGSTGSPKLVRLSHHNLVANAQSIAQYLQFGVGERAATSLPLQYSYGMSVVNSHLLAGHRLAVTGRSLADPAFWRFFDAAGATNFQGVPHTFEILERSGFLERRHPTLRHFTQAGGRLGADAVRRFATYANAAGARFYVMYGQTEAAPRIAYVRPEDVLDHPDTIGQAIPGGSLCVEAAPGVPAADGEAGELVYRGPNVMMGYALARSDLARPNETAELRTGDIAVRLPHGGFRITGRASRFLKLFGLRIGLDDVERRLRAAGIEAVATGDDRQLVLALTVTCDPAALSAVVESGIGLPAGAYRVVHVAQVPRLDNGKVDYRAIVATPSAEPSGRAGDTILAAARIQFRDPALDGSKSFVALGGDSLTYVEFAMVVEERLGHLPDGWERRPIAALDALAPGHRAPSAKRQVPIDICLRSALIALVLVHHATAFAFAGAAHALLAIAGYNFGRFQSRQILEGRAARVMRNLVLTVVLPYFAVLAVIFAHLGHIYLPNYLLISTYFDVDGNTRRPTIYWFIEDYIVVSVFMTLVLCLPPIRDRFARTEIGTVAGLFAACAGLRLLHDVAPRLGTTAHGVDLFNPNTPIMVACVFAFGWLIYALEARGAKAWALLVLPLFVVVPPSGVEVSANLFVVAMGVLVMFRTVRVPRRLAVLLTTIAASSLYIYIGQSFVLSAARTAFGYDHREASAVVAFATAAFIACIAFGVGLKLLVDRLTALVADRTSRRVSGREQIAGAGDARHPPP